MELTDWQLLSQGWKGLQEQKMNIQILAEWMGEGFLMEREIWSPQLCLHRLQGLNCLQTGWHPSLEQSVSAFGDGQGNERDGGAVG